MGLEVREEAPTPGCKVLRVAGELDSATFELFEQSIRAAIGDEVRSVLVDLSKVQVLTSAGMGVILSFVSEFSDTPVKFMIFGAGKTVLEMMDTVGLLTLVPHAQTEAEALKLAKA